MLCLMACSPMREQPPPTAPSAEALLRRLLQTYRNALVYRDHGSISDDSPLPLKVFDWFVYGNNYETFETSFERGGEAHLAYHGYRLMQITAAASMFPDAGSALAGVSSGASVIAPRLLVAGRHSLAEIQNAQVLGARRLREHECWVVKGVWIVQGLEGRRPAYTLWIDRASSLLLRVRVTQGGPNSAEATIDYWPAITLRAPQAVP